MELSQEILKGLELLGDFKQLPDQAFKELVQVCFGVAVNEISEKRVEGLYRFCSFVLSFNYF